MQQTIKLYYLGRAPADLATQTIKQPNAYLSMITLYIGCTPERPYAVLVFQNTLDSHQTEIIDKSNSASKRFVQSLLWSSEQSMICWYHGHVAPPDIA